MTSGPHLGAHPSAAALWLRPWPSRLAQGVPAQGLTILLRVVVIAVAVLATAAVHISARPATLCVLRTLTGIPCPFCGGTTAAVHLGHGDLRGALAVSPLAVAMIGAAPFVGVAPMPSWWRRPLIRLGLLGAILLFGELWQLSRFGHLPSVAG